MNLFKFFFLLFLTFGCSTTPKTQIGTKRETASSQIRFERPDKGSPVSEKERQQATDELISLITDIKYFDFIDSRIHGMPEGDSSKPFWWATMWTGVKVQKLNDKVTYTHSTDGADNAGIQTSPYLEAACFAYRLTGEQKYAQLARRLMRGMSSWILSSARSANETPQILSRAFYPQSFHTTEGGRDLFVNYEDSRPGINAITSNYVHIPNNPYFGDIWLKNNRSVDDIGHMLRAIAHLQGCRDVFDIETRADLDQMTALYSAWAADVDANRFIIPTYNLNAERIVNKKGLGNYNTFKFLGFDPTCVEKLAVRLLHSNNSGNLKCKKGISFLERLGAKYLQNDAIQILRTHHVAAVALAQLKSQTELAKKLMNGLSDRMKRDLRVARNIKLSPKFDIQDIATSLIESHNAGVSMTSDEIRFIYERLHSAYIGMRGPAHHNTFHLFDSSVPDGNYSFDPPHIGLYFYAIGSMIGSCTSSFQNPNGRILLDCDRLKTALLKD